MNEKHSFYFKQFSVRHDRSPMKVGTDGVLLGAWASVQGAAEILDIGTGSGVIALMLAQRTPAGSHIDAIDITEASASQAAENVASSPWPAKVNVVHSALQAFPVIRKYDLIVSNPPFFVASTAPPSPVRETARHANQLSHADLLNGVRGRLNENGRFCVILPTSEGILFQATAAEAGLACSRKTEFYSRTEKPQERWLLEFVAHPVSTPVASRLVLYGEGQAWSDNYKRLMRDFYLGA